MLNVPENSIDQPMCGDGIVDGDVIGYRVKFRQRRFGPDYLSHRVMRFLACA